MVDKTNQTYRFAGRYVSVLLAIRAFLVSTSLGHNAQ